MSGENGKKETPAQSEAERKSDPVGSAVKRYRDKGYKIMVINIPLTGEWVYKRFMESMLAMTSGDAYNYLMSEKIKTFINICGDFPIDHNRSKSIKIAIDKFKADYIMQLDTDQTFHQMTIADLLHSLHKPAPDGSEVEIVTGMYYLKKPPFRPVLGICKGWNKDLALNEKYLRERGFVCHGECGDERHKTGTHQLVRFQAPHYWPSDKIFRSDVIGVGCVLSKASMWKKLEYPYFRYSPNPITGPEDNDAQQISEDMFWCASMHLAGIKVWVNPAVQCGHIGTIEINYDMYKGHFKAALEHVDSLPKDDPLRATFKREVLDLR